MKTWKFPSSTGTAQYTVTLADDGKLLCDCKGWTMKRGTNPRHCKHTKAVAAAATGSDLVTAGDYVFLVARPGAAEPKKRVPLGAYNPPRGSAAATPTPAPMLASAMTYPVTGVAFDARYGGGEWVMEEKIDGHRCTVRVQDGIVSAFSRPRAGATAANARALPPHIVEQLARFPDGIYDGELVAPSGKAWDVVVVGSRLVFVVFDLLDDESLRQPYCLRRGRLLAILAEMPDDQTAVSTVESLTPCYRDVENIWQRGGEGVILKRLDSRYRPGHRSPDWVKVKEAHAATLTLTGYQAGKSGPYSTLVLRDAAGVETTVKTLGNAMLRAVTAAPDSFIGRQVVITYQEKTPGGTYRHGIFDHFAGEGERAAR
jgi:hypothetical protein